MEKTTKAVKFAAKAHDGMYRKRDKVPYILHPMEAAAVTGTITNDEDVIAAALLHDVVEDAGITLEEIREQFGERVALLVASETEDKREELPSEETWDIRKQESLKVLRDAEDEGVAILWLGDKLANIRSFYRHWRIDGDRIWQDFNQKDARKQAWYYRSIASYTSQLKDTAAWQEYNELVNIIFGKVE